MTENYQRIIEVILLEKEKVNLEKQVHKETKLGISQRTIVSIEEAGLRKIQIDCKIVKDYAGNLIQ